ncbi:MAG TPA: WecB/TagA/CpsF family glycosyltransferase [Pilimelia sp.]|nr:WecB/TagA/CpsF family glycosyltransferase [Pilimelia sp.]
MGTEPGPAAVGDRPVKRDVLGVLVDAVDHDAAVRRVLGAARERRPLAGTALAVHGLMCAVRDPALRSRINALDLVTADGQPVRWALNWLHGARLADWVSGPEVAADLTRGLAAEGLPVYLYGATAATVADLATALRQHAPGLVVAGAEPSRFRTAAPGELAATADRIVRSGARAVLVGLGCPRQEVLVHALRPLLPMPALAVGAAFDFHAGRLPRAPRWMRRRGLSWLWRLALEPRRLWRRYLLLNPLFLALLAVQRARLWRPAPPPPPRPLAVPV